MSVWSDTRQFWLKFYPELVPDEPTWPATQTLEESTVWASYFHVAEELDELSKAIQEMDLAAAADAIADAVYVLGGMAAKLGLPMDEVWDAVHRANLAKARGNGRRGVFDVIKPAGWEPPDIEAIVQGRTPCQ